jgi:hypothetical protein
VDAAPNDDARGVLDVLPVTKMPADRPIVVVFSQSMDPDSIRLGETFIVEKVSQSDVGGTIGNAEIVEGRLEKNNQRIRFYPDEPWDKGSFYRYTMVSAPDGNCGNVICGKNNMALQTDVLKDPTDNGGDPMTIYFEGAEERDTVFTPLRNLPIRDVNSNYETDCDTPGGTECLEPFAADPNGEGGFEPSANAAKLTVIGQQAEALEVSVDAKVGCEPDRDCPDNKFIYQTYGLNTEVIGPTTDPETGKDGIRVLLYPTMLVTTSASVFMEGFGEQRTGPQILRMRYSKQDGKRDGLIEGIIIEGEEGQPVFKTEAELMLDAPNLKLPEATATLVDHDLYSKPFSLELEGDMTFFDDGRMQIEQITNNAPKITVNVNVTVPILDEFLTYSGCVEDTEDIIGCLDSDSQESDDGDIVIPLEIPEKGVYLNFISNPVKDLPRELRQTTPEQ